MKKLRNSIGKWYQPSILFSCFLLKIFGFGFYHQDFVSCFLCFVSCFFLGNAHTTSWIMNHHGFDHYRVSQSWFGV